MRHRSKKKEAEYRLRRPLVVVLAVLVGVDAVHLVGIAFGAGWSPCIGPILGAILTYTASEADLQRGMVLLLSYSMGLAIPFIAAALAVDWFLTAFTKFRKYLGYVQKVAGVLLIAVGILMVTNYFTILATALQALTPEFLRSRI